MKLDVFINNNYSYLLTVAKRIAKSEAEDLLNNTYLIIFDKQNFELPDDNNGAIKYFVKCMSNNFSLSKSSFNSEKKKKEVAIENYFFESIQDDAEQEVSEKSITEFKSTLDEHEKIFFELHYEEEVSLRSIAKEFREISVDKEVVNKIKNRIKDKIIDKWK